LKHYLLETEILPPDHNCILWLLPILNNACILSNGLCMPINYFVTIWLVLSPPFSLLNCFIPGNSQYAQVNVSEKKNIGVLYRDFFNRYKSTL